MAGELMARLSQDPAYLLRIAQQQQKRESRLLENQRAMAPILEELARAGFEVSSIADLRQKGVNYRPVIPILVRWLPQVANSAVKGDLIRTLSIPAAKALVLPFFMREFQVVDDPEGTLREDLGNGIEILADDSIFEELVPLAEGKQYGRNRNFLVLALGKMRNPRAVDVLIRLLEDDEVVVSAIMALGKLKAPAARPRLERFVQNPNANLRREAEKALAKIDKAALRK